MISDLEKKKQAEAHDYEDDFSVNPKRKRKGGADKIYQYSTKQERNTITKKVGRAIVSIARGIFEDFKTKAFNSAFTPQEIHELAVSSEESVTKLLLSKPIIQEIVENKGIMELVNSLNKDTGDEEQPDAVTIRERQSLLYTVMTIPETTQKKVHLKKLAEGAKNFSLGRNVIEKRDKKDVPKKERTVEEKKEGLKMYQEFIKSDSFTTPTVKEPSDTAPVSPSDIKNKDIRDFLIKPIMNNNNKNSNNDNNKNVTELNNTDESNDEINNNNNNNNNNNKDSSANNNNITNNDIIYNNNCYSNDEKNDTNSNYIIYSASNRESNNDDIFNSSINDDKIDNNNNNNNNNDCNSIYNNKIICSSASDIINNIKSFDNLNEVYRSIVQNNSHKTALWPQNLRGKSEFYIQLKQLKELHKGKVLSDSSFKESLIRLIFKCYTFKYIKRTEYILIGKTTGDGYCLFRSILQVIKRQEKYIKHCASQEKNAARLNTIQEISKLDLNLFDEKERNVLMNHLKADYDYYNELLPSVIKDELVYAAYDDYMKWLVEVMKYLSQYDQINDSLKLPHKLWGKLYGHNSLTFCRRLNHHLLTYSNPETPMLNYDYIELISSSLLSPCQSNVFSLDTLKKVYFGGSKSTILLANGHFTPIEMCGDEIQSLNIAIEIIVECLFVIHSKNDYSTPKPTNNIDFDFVDENDSISPVVEKVYVSSKKLKQLENLLTIKKIMDPELITLLNELKVN